MAEDPLIGQVLHDTHEVLRLIGKGGMGSVYEARHVHLNKSFAVKVLDPRFAEHDTVFARFKREALIASSLGHPAIVQVVDFYLHDDGRPCMVMEHLQGSDLGEVLNERKSLPPEELMPIISQVAGALQAVHDKKIVHRDMKPGNIFLADQEDGTIQAKVLDFGISKIKNPDDGVDTLTANHTILGTPHFMSPEQALGEVGDVDWRTDIFALATICYYSMSGMLPFNAPSLHGVLVKIQTLEPARIVGLAPEVSGGVHLVLQKAMAKEKENRYERVEQFALELQQALAADGGAKTEAEERKSPVYATMVDREASHPAEPVESTEAAPRGVVGPAVREQPVDPTSETIEQGSLASPAPTSREHSNPNITNVLPLDELLEESSHAAVGSGRPEPHRGTASTPGVGRIAPHAVAPPASAPTREPVPISPAVPSQVSPDTTLSGSAGELPTRAVQQPRKIPIKLLAIAGVGLVVILGVGLIIMSGSKQSPSPEVNSIPASATAQVQPTTHDKRPRNAPPAKIPPPESAPAVPETDPGPVAEPIPELKQKPKVIEKPSVVEKVKITLMVRPTQATVQVDGKPASGNPVLLPKDGKKHLLAVEARGYVPHRQDLHSERDQVVKVTLARLKGKKQRKSPTIRFKSGDDEWGDPFQAKPRGARKRKKAKEDGFSSLDTPPPLIKPPARNKPRPKRRKPKQKSNDEAFDSL